MLYGPLVTPACTGADASGAATVTSATAVRGYLYGITLKHAGDDPDTTDVTITTQGTDNAPALTLLSRANSHADETLYPRVDSCKASDASALSANNTMILIDDKVTVTIAQANTGDIWTVWLWMLAE
jgi:hypothetical protein